MMNGEKFICKKCGEKFYEMPLSHGIVHFTFYPNRPKPTKKCNGKIVEIVIGEEKYCQ
jgi:hypothetical protein